MSEKSHCEISLRNGKRTQITNKHTANSFWVSLKRIVPGGSQLSKTRLPVGKLESQTITGKGKQCACT